MKKLPPKVVATQLSLFAGTETQYKVGKNGRLIRIRGQRIYRNAPDNYRERRGFGEK